MKRLYVGLVAAITIALIACTAREEAKDAYTIQSKACLVAYDDGAHQRSCLEYVRNRWTEAGAPPAATIAQPFDGGKPVLQ